MFHFDTAAYMPRMFVVMLGFLQHCSFDLIKSTKKETTKQVKFKSLGLARDKGKHVIHYHRDNTDSFLSNGEKKWELCVQYHAVKR